MFNVTVINIKKTTNYIITLIISLVCIYVLNKNITKIQTSTIIEISLSDKLINVLNREIPAIESTHNISINTIKEDLEENLENSKIAKIIETELVQTESNNNQDNTLVAKDNQIIDKAKENELENTSNEEKIEEINNNITTQIVTKNPITESNNVEINGVKIKNETEFEINDNIMQNKLDINKNNVLIFHTHTCESFTPSEKFNYEQTGNFRTTDLNYSVAKVGDELTKYLSEFEFNVIHDKTYHDYPAYTGSYNRSKETVDKLLKTNPCDIIIDLHRDAIGSKSNYDPSVKIGDETVAQLMFVMGTNGGGLYHPNWKSNLEFAIKVQEKANEMYPGLFKPIIVRNSRYNQHLGKAACIIEVGSTGNTLEQCIGSMKYLSKVLDEVLK